MKLDACMSLTFNGQCEAAFKLYERCFDGKIAFMMTWAESPMAGDAPPEWGKKILHARLNLGDTSLVGGDVLPQQYERPQGFSVLLSVADAADCDRMFAALSENGRVQVPMQKTFWAERYGMVTDQFGIPWSINCEPVS